MFEEIKMLNLMKDFCTVNMYYALYNNQLIGTTFLLLYIGNKKHRKNETKVKLRVFFSIIV